MTTESDTTLVTVTTPDGEEDVALPTGLLDMLAEEGESDADVVADLALMSCAQRVHAAVHHGQGGPDAEMEAIESTTMELFEERFGMTFGEATGHDH
mgnify:CR=1 FL=1|jgi:hypothetical protein